MEKVTKVVWGIIGAGDVCEKKSAPAMNKITNSEIKMIMRRNPDKAKDYAQRHKIPNWSSDVQTILRDPNINAVYIATPPNAHAELVIQAAEAGKAVYVEKPMARTYKECLAMIEACEKYKVPLFVAYYRRALPNFLKVKELIDQGAIGEVRMVNIEMYQPMNPDIVTHQENNWRVNPEISGGGYFYDLASHQLDLLDFLFGPIGKAAGFHANQSKSYQAEDIVTGSFSFENGIMGSGSWCFSTGKACEKETTVISGSKGKIEFGTFANTNVWLDSEIQGKKVFEFTMPEHIQQPFIQLIVNDLTGKGSCPSTGISAARTNFVIDKIFNRI
jgi:predicted dehydrogenase